MKTTFVDNIAIFSSSIREKAGGFFVIGHERSIKLRRNVFASLVLKGITACISLLIIPITLHYVNPTQYGIWLTLSSMIAWFNLMDIGLANGLKNKVAEANATKQVDSIKAYISTTYAVLSAIAICIFLLFLVGNYFLDWGYILNFNDPFLTNLNAIASIMMAAFCVQFFLQPLTSILTALHSAAAVSLIFAIGQIGCLAGIYLLTYYTSGSLLYLTLLLTGVPIVVQLLATVWWFKNSLAQYRPNFRAIDLKHARSLLSAGGAFFFVQIGSLILFQTDNIIVTQLFGPEQVTIFNISYKLFSIISILFTIAMTPLWPAFTDAYAKKDIEWIKGVFAKMYKYFLILTVCSIGLLIFSTNIFDIWLGDSVTIPLELSIVMAIYVIAICWMTIHCYFINGIGKVRLQMYLYIGSTVINIPLAIVLGKKFGLIGITLSNVFVVIFMSEILRIQCGKIIKNSAFGIWNK
jgi:O-antigen/teichoic acid export membrane protein